VEPETTDCVGLVGAGEPVDALRHRFETAGLRVAMAGASDDKDASIVAMAVRCGGVVVTTFGTEAPLRAAFADRDAATARNDLVVLDVSPIAPATQRDLASSVRPSSVTLVGGRVLMRFRDGAPTPTLYIDDDATRVVPLRRVLASFGDDLVITGATGRAKALGLIDDLLAGVNAAVVNEAMALGRSAGLDAPTLVSLLQKGSGATSVMAHATVAPRDTAASSAALARVVSAAQQADHSVLFGSVAIGVLLRQSHLAVGLDAAPVNCDVRRDRQVAA